MVDKITDPLNSSGILLPTAVSLDFVYLLGVQIIDMTQMGVRCIAYLFFLLSMILYETI